MDEPASLKFKIIIADGGDIVALFEEYRPDILILVLDLNDSRSEEEMIAIIERETHQKYITIGSYRWGDDPKPPRVG